MLCARSCVVTVVVRQSVGDQVFPACSIHRGKEGLTPKARSHT